jgi:hypothetical protein
MTHKTKALDITIEMYTNKVAFNVISSTTNPIVIGLSWLILHKPQVDRYTKNLHFNLPQKITSNCEKPTSKNIISEGKDYHLDKSCTKSFECNKCLGSTQDVKSSKVLFVGTRAFVQVAKKGKTFLIYVLPTSDVEPPRHEIPSQYKEFKDMFEKKNVDTLPEHRPYDYTIDLGKGTQLPFGLIYNLSQNKLCSSL